MNSITRHIYLGIVAALALMSVGASAQAQVTQESLPEQTVYSDFVVGPGKVEAEMNPGETRTFELSVSNRLGTAKVFTLDEEDFTGSQDTTRPIVLLGDDRGPYSLKDSLTIATSSLLIPHGNKARIKVTIKVPEDAQPGGLYGSVVVGTASNRVETDSSGAAIGKSPLITRIGTLFFIRVKGPVEVNGRLSKFSITGDKTMLWDTKAVSFAILFENTGNVHVNPSGTIVISNMLGSTVGTLEVEPWFAMPQSLRFREVEWHPPFLFGRYVAHAAINPGYGNISQEATIVFWVIPWKIILAVLIILIIVIGGIRWIGSRFKIVSKKKK